MYKYKKLRRTNKHTNSGVDQTTTLKLYTVKNGGLARIYPEKKLRDSQNFRDRALHPEKGFGKRPIPITFSEYCVIPIVFSAKRAFHERLFGMVPLSRVNIRNIPKILSG